MSKKHRQAKRAAAPTAQPAAPVEPITSLGKKIIWSGVALIALGFAVLSRADAMGRNWAAALSPFLILGGYLVVGSGIFAPEKLPTTQDAPAPEPAPSGGVSGPEQTI